MRWFFPSNNGGQESGFHDAGVETFRGNIDRYIARESIQNCLDAVDDKTRPVRVVFQLRDLPVESVPGVAKLKDTLKRCSDYWKSDKKARAFFDKAVKLLSEKTIPVLRIGDYNTTGVLGSDTDRSGNWYNLVKCAGSSSKGGGEGGSFGIGKNAPFAASALRTVFYSTLNKDNEQIFQGVARLATHDDDKGERVQATGLYGGNGGESIRTPSEIPWEFKRDVPGTDIHVLGYQPGEEWEVDLTYSVLENFWPAINTGLLTVEIAGTTIDKQRLPELMEKFAAEKGFTGHFYYRASVSPAAKVFNVDLPTLGQVSLNLLPGDVGLPKRVALSRQTGMVIQHRAFRSIIPFSGYFVCNNNQGNERLREMEPPRHDAWDKDLPEKNSGRKVLNELFGWISDCIEKLRPSDDSQIISIPDLYKFLPDDEDAEQPGLDDEPEGTVSEETAEKRPSQLPISSRPMNRPQAATEPDSQESDEAEDEIVAGAGDSPTGGGGAGGGGGDGDGGGGGEEGQGEGETQPAGGSGGDKPKHPIPVRFRSFLAEENAGSYFLVITPDATKKGDLSIFAVGDDARREPLAIANAENMKGEPLAVEEPNRISGVALTKNQPLRIKVDLKEPERLALEVSAYEA